MQTVTLVGIFVASGGNLAATYVANVANQLIFTILQERCALRAKEVGGWVGGVGVGVGVGVYVGMWVWVYGCGCGYVCVSVFILRILENLDFMSSPNLAI